MSPKLLEVVLLHIIERSHVKLVQVRVEIILVYRHLRLRSARRLTKRASRD